LTGFLQNIDALEGFIHLYSDDPGLVTLMIHIAILGMRNDLCWDALQANGWSAQQLKSLQQACDVDRNLLAKVSTAFEAERVARLQRIEVFRSHSFESLIARDEPILKSFGTSDSNIAAAIGPRTFRQWVFHPVWSFCWADQEAANY